MNRGGGCRGRQKVESGGCDVGEGEEATSSGFV